MQSFDGSYLLFASIRKCVHIYVPQVRDLAFASVHTCIPVLVSTAVRWRICNVGLLFAQCTLYNIMGRRTYASNSASLDDDLVAALQSLWHFDFGKAMNNTELQRAAEAGSSLFEVSYLRRAYDFVNLNVSMITW